MNELAAKECLREYRRADATASVEEHFGRHMETLRLIEKIHPRPRRVCDVATFGMLLPALRELYGLQEIVSTGSTWDGESSELHFVWSDGRPYHSFQHDRFDIATTFPYPDHAFDLVLFTEVLEHLSRDPMHTMSELNRILQPGGWLILSTPNCISTRAFFRAIRGDHPYNWSQYSRSGNSDRHNREYTPSEVNAVLSASGFSAKHLYCRDVYNNRRRTMMAMCNRALWAIRRMAGRRSQLNWSGEIIFALAQKTGEVVDRHPPFLYY